MPSAWSLNPLFTCLCGKSTGVFGSGVHTKSPRGALCGGLSQETPRPPADERGRGRARNGRNCGDTEPAAWRADGAASRRVGRQAVLVQGGTLCGGLVFRPDRPRAQRVDGRGRRRRRFSDARHVCRPGEGTSSGQHGRLRHESRALPAALPADDKKQKACNCRESNPGRPRGRRASYH